MNQFYGDEKLGENKKSLIVEWFNELCNIQRRGNERLNKDENHYAKPLGTFRFSRLPVTKRHFG